MSAVQPLNSGDRGARTLTEGPSPSPPPHLKVLEWNAVGVWLPLEDCAVCRVELEDQCRYCLTEHGVPLSFSSSSIATSRSPQQPLGQNRSATRIDRHGVLAQEELYTAALQYVCPVVRGACHHVFHVHCLQEWHEKSNICPLCGMAWKAVAVVPTNVKKSDVGAVLLGEEVR